MLTRGHLSITSGNQLHYLLPIEGFSKSDLCVNLICNELTVGVVQVRRLLGATSDGELSKRRKRCFTQIGLDLMVMKKYYGINSPLGILTDYNEWIMCWLRDSESLAVAEGESESEDEDEDEDEVEDAGVQEEQHHFQVDRHADNAPITIRYKSYPYNHDNLIQMIGTFLCKSLFNSDPKILLKIVNGNKYLKLSTFFWSTLILKKNPVRTITPKTTDDLFIV
uniref:Uncharacterized protein n=1 Tax=Strigamia maritima TaxID=126957 RepID=T1J4Q9_STRMM